MLRALTGAWGLYFLFDALFWGLYPLYVTRDLGISPASLGLIYAVGSVGGVLGALFVTPITRRFGVGRTMAGALLVGALGELCIPLAGVAAGAPRLAAVLALGLGEVLVRSSDWLFAVNFASLRQAVTPDRLQGRVNATVRVFTAGAAPIGAFVGGMLGEALGLPTTVLVGALGVLLAFLWVALSPARSLRSLPEPAPPPDQAPEFRGGRRAPPAPGPASAMRHGRAPSPPELLEADPQGRQTRGPRPRPCCRPVARAGRPPGPTPQVRPPPRRGRPRLPGHTGGAARRRPPRSSRPAVARPGPHGVGRFGRFPARAAAGSSRASAAGDGGAGGPAPRGGPGRWYAAGARRGRTLRPGRRRRHGAAGARAGDRGRGRRGPPRPGPRGGGRSSGRAATRGRGRGERRA